MRISSTLHPSHNPDRCRVIPGQHQHRRPIPPCLRDQLRSPPAEPSDIHRNPIGRALVVGEGGDHGVGDGQPGSAESRNQPRLEQRPWPCPKSDLGFVIAVRNTDNMQVHGHSSVVRGNTLGNIGPCACDNGAKRRPLQSPNVSRSTGNGASRLSPTSNTDPTQRPVADPDAPSHYDVLGVKFDATPQQVTRAYREAMKRIHPDGKKESARAAAEEQAKTLNIAYAVLSSPTKREAYDREIRAQTIQDQLMSRYVGGISPLDQYSTDMTGERFRKEPTAHQRQDQRAANRTAVVSMAMAFGGFALLLLVTVILWGVISTLIGR